MGKVILKGFKVMKILCTYTVNHVINEEKTTGRVLVGLHSMQKDGNTYEYIKTYKLAKNCPDLATGLSGDLLFTDRGKVAGFNPNK